MVQPVYRSSKGILRGTAVGLQAVHFLEVQIKKWIVLEERERERLGLLFIQSHFLDTHSLLAVPIDYKVSVSGMFLKFTDQLSKARRAKQNHS